MLQLMVLPNFDVFCDLSQNRRTAAWNLFVLYDNETKYYRFTFFYFKIFQHNSKAGLCPLWRTRKMPFDVICCLYKLKPSHWLLCVAKNCDWTRKITPLSNLIRASLLVECKRRIEPRNIQNLLDKSSPSFYNHSSSVNRKAWMLPWILQKLKKYAWKTCGCG